MSFSLRSVVFVALFLALSVVACDGYPPIQDGGEVIDTPPEITRDDPEFLSPPIVVAPLLGCGASVRVKGFVPGAKIVVTADGVPVGGAIGTETWDEGEAVPVDPPLTTGQVVTATQEFGGALSGSSAAVVVQDHTDVYPNGLPTPRFPALQLYECGRATVVDSLPPGGDVSVLSQVASGTESRVGFVHGVKERQTVGISPAFELGASISAESEICTDTSPRSLTHVTQSAPASLPDPQVEDLWDGGTRVVVGGLVNGAIVTIKKGGNTIAGGGAPAGVVWFAVDPPVAEGDSLKIQQELCDVASGETEVTVGACSDLPAPIMHAPQAGDTVVRFQSFVYGAGIRIYADGVQIGDGGPDEVAVSPPLVDGQTLVAVHVQGNCVSPQAHTLVVGSGIDDPSTAGGCGFREFEYGDDGSLRTDVSQYFNSPSSSVGESMDAVPLHGTGRFPNGLGPFPLVLIVHGNHNPLEASDPGYDYLLDLLASHCMIAVSVDENFLNGGVWGEMDARAIVLLRHLQLWRGWHQDPSHEFFTRVDLDGVGLAGHSRGGEAVVAANLLNATLHDPSDPAHDFGFGIQSLYAIAPVDGQFDAGPILHRGADYYVMHGSHDGDVSDFGGHRTHDRALPVDETSSDFKGLLYVYGANHAQWNEVWSPSGDPASITPTGDLISEADQMQIGESYIASVFLAGLRGFSQLKQFLAGEVTFASLPGGVTRVFQFVDPSRVFVNHYEEDDDLTTGSIAGATDSVVGALSPYIDYAMSDAGAPHFFWGRSDGVVAGWSAPDSEMVAQVTPALRAAAKDRPRLAFRVAQTHESSSSKNIPGVDKDFTVSLRFGSIVGPSVLVSDYARLPYPAVTSPAPWGGGPKTVMQTVRIPLADLMPPRAETLDPIDSWTQIRFRFDLMATGLVGIDEVQVTK